MFFPSPSWPLWCFPLFSSTLCLPTFYLSEVLCSVFSPGRLSLMHTDVWICQGVHWALQGYDQYWFLFSSCWWMVCQYEISKKKTIPLVNKWTVNMSSPVKHSVCQVLRKTCYMIFSDWHADKATAWTWVKCLISFNFSLTVQSSLVLGYYSFSKQKIEKTSRTNWTEKTKNIEALECLDSSLSIIYTRIDETSDISITKAALYQLTRDKTPLSPCNRYPSCYHH